jgi:dihydroorotate dehydrogenase
VIATNTTLSREGVEGMPNAAETGGLSGKPVFRKSTAVQQTGSCAGWRAADQALAAS